MNLNGFCPIRVGEKRRRAVGGFDNSQHVGLTIKTSPTRLAAGFREKEQFLFAIEGYM